jgi:hypothetical protein
MPRNTRIVIAGRAGRTGRAEKADKVGVEKSTYPSHNGTPHLQRNPVRKGIAVK